MDNYVRPDVGSGGELLGQEPLFWVMAAAAAVASFVGAFIGGLIVAGA